MTSAAAPVLGVAVGLAALGAGLAGIAAAGDDWVRVSPPGGAYTAYLPATPAGTSRALADAVFARLTRRASDQRPGESAQKAAAGLQRNAESVEQTGR